MKAKSISANATPVMLKKFNPFAHNEFITDSILPRTSLLVEVKTPLTEFIPAITAPQVPLNAEVIKAATKPLDFHR